MDKRECCCSCCDKCGGDWRETAGIIAIAVCYTILGIAIGIGLCKFWPDFWRWVGCVR